MSVTIALSNPVVSLSESDLARHRRNAQISGIGDLGISRLAAAKVLVVGAGGLGSPVLTYLASTGVGTIGVCDFDLVEFGNLPRQIIHPEANVGREKTASAAERIHQLNSNVCVQLAPRLTAENIAQVCSDYDLVVECSDNFDTKYLVSDWCAAEYKPLVWGTVVGTRFQISVFFNGETGQYPKTTLRDLFPTPPAPHTTPSSKTVGVLSTAVGVCGTLMATEVVKLIAGCGQPLIGKVLVADVANSQFNLLPFI